MVKTKKKPYKRSRGLCCHILLLCHPSIVFNGAIGRYGGWKTLFQGKIFGEVGVQEQVHPSKVQWWPFVDPGPPQVAHLLCFLKGQSLEKQPAHFVCYLDPQHKTVIWVVVLSFEYDIIQLGVRLSEGPGFLTWRTGDIGTFCYSSTFTNNTAVGYFGSDVVRSDDISSPNTHCHCCSTRVW